MNNAVFGKTMEIVRKRTDIKLATTKRRRNQNQGIIPHIFYIKFISNRNEKTEILINKLVHLGLSVLQLSKILMYEFW